MERKRCGAGGSDVMQNAPEKTVLQPRKLLSPRAIGRILEDAARVWLADHGAQLIAPLRRAAGLVGADLLRLRLLMLEHRLSGNARLTRLVKAALSDIQTHVGTLVGPPQTLQAPERMTRALVLSMPRMCEGRLQRGVILIKFTETFRFFFHFVDIPALLRYFRVVLEPSWSGYCLPEILFWTGFEDPVIVQASERLDREFLDELATNLIQVPIGASDWVDHRIFRPLGHERTYDVIYIANLSPIKRVHVLLSALREAAAQGVALRTVIVLSSWGGNRAAFEAMLDFYGVRPYVTVMMNLSQAELNDWLNRSRVSVLLSRKEGSNKTLFESLFAGTPVLLLRSNIGVNKEYINASTGRLASEAELPGTLIDLARNSHPELTPREWAMANIAPELSTRTLERALAGTDPGGVSTPLLVKVNTPEAAYMYPDQASGVPPLKEVLGCFLKSAGAAGPARFQEMVEEGPADYRTATESPPICSTR